MAPDQAKGGGPAEIEVVWRYQVDPGEAGMPRSAILTGVPRAGYALTSIACRTPNSTHDAEVIEGVTPDWRDPDSGIQFIFATGM